MQRLFFSSIAILLIGHSFVAAPVRADDPLAAPADRAATAPAAKPASGQPPTSGETPNAGAKPASGDAAAKGDPAKAKPEDTPKPKVIRREEAATGDANPEELKATVGEDGRVAFEFRNQPWLDLVQWLAEISEMPLDWQELPGDRVNLTSPGRYTVEEARDLFNRHLLARGYTLLKLDGGLIIAKTENINPAIVPRVEPEELAGLSPHTFVRTSLDVGWLSAEKLAAELAPMISSNGRLTALTSTNRIEAMDASVNLLQIAQLLTQERSESNRESLAPEFKLRHLPADEAKSMLEEFLGVKKEAAAPITPQQMQMMQQVRSQNPNQPPPEPKLPEISIVANVRQNSVIIRAPPDRVAIATEFLKRVDVPSGSMVSLADVQNRVQVYRLASLDPEKLVEIVSEMNVLEPTTRMRVDKENQALIVSGSGADRFIIGSLIERLDGSGRRFEVLQLRRLDAAEVAESIAFLMGQKEEEESQSRRPYYYFGSTSNEEDKAKTDEFRVASNVRYRQILLWANEIEMEEVRSLLVKLGELPPAGGSRQPFRVIDAAATPETYEYLQQLRMQWQQLSGNPLELPDREQFQDPNAELVPKRKENPPAGEESPSRPNRAIEVDEEKERPDEDLAQGMRDAEANEPEQYHLARAQAPGAPEDELPQLPPVESTQDFDRLFPDAADSAKEPPPPAEDAGDASPPPAIRITIDGNGNLMLSSEDTRALDQLESLMLQVAPPQRPYRVFAIEHAAAYWMQLNLEDYFADAEDAEDSEADRFFGWYFGMGNDKEKKKETGLGAGAKLRFVADDDTNTIVVSGATREQLRTVEELIELWDVPAPVNKRKTRFTRLVPVSYGKAGKLAETVKDAYRDLLSSNDKAFQKSETRERGGASNTPRNRDGDGTDLVDTANGQNGGGADFAFKGKLSIGIDEIGNTLLVSAEGEPLLDLVCDMIRQLDDAAKPQGGVEVLQFSGGISGRSLQDALRAFSTASDRVDSKREGRPVKEPLE